MKISSYVTTLLLLFILLDNLIGVYLVLQYMKVMYGEIFIGVMEFIFLCMCTQDVTIARNRRDKHARIVTSTATVLMHTIKL